MCVMYVSKLANTGGGQRVTISDEPITVASDCGPCDS